MTEQFKPESPTRTEFFQWYGEAKAAERADREKRKPQRVAEAKDAAKQNRSDQNYAGQFIGHLDEMLKSPAWRALSNAGRMVLSRVEMELMAHGGRKAQNVGLIVTHAQFVDYGIPENSVARGIREAVQLGFVEIDAGCAGNQNSAKANTFRLTYRPCPKSKGKAGGTHEWRQFWQHSIEECRALAKDARGRKRAGYRPSDRASLKRNTEEITE
jgi:hypothetical protein